VIATIQTDPLPKRDGIGVCWIGGESQGAGGEAAPIVCVNRQAVKSTAQGERRGSGRDIRPGLLAERVDHDLCQPAAA
jgi:hypothetical protein